LKFFRQNNYTEKAKILYFLNLVYFLSLLGLWQNHVLYWPLTDLMWHNRTPFGKSVVNKYGSVCYYYRSFFHGTLHMWSWIDEEHNYKEKNFYFSNMKKIIKHYPMTDRLIVTQGYMKSYLHLIWHYPSMPKYPSECTGWSNLPQILNFQNTFDRAWNEIRMKIQTENFFGILISTRLACIRDPL
jgi:hypothetical protein